MSFFVSLLFSHKPLKNHPEKKEELRKWLAVEVGRIQGLRGAIEASVRIYCEGEQGHFLDALGFSQAPPAEIASLCIANLSEMSARILGPNPSKREVHGFSEAGMNLCRLFHERIMNLYPYATMGIWLCPLKGTKKVNAPLETKEVSSLDEVFQQGLVPNQILLFK